MLRIDAVRQLPSNGFIGCREALLQPRFGLLDRRSEGGIQDPGNGALL
ncbi:MAG: hypothetical protein R6V60_16245 [Desulfobacterales bacterium]